jgi:pimeloyl-ACP methyl ester carboxylesterase
MTTWSRAYRPLRLRTLLRQTLVLLSAEALLFATYRDHQAAAQWAPHLLVAMTMWALVNLLWLALKGAPAGGQVVTLLAWHLFAVFPDVLLTAGSPHDDWMNVFLGHVALHHVSGGEYLWLFSAVVAGGAYAAVLCGWVRARRSELAAGMAPGIGLGGTHLVRPQCAVDRTELGHHRFGPPQSPAAVLLHGLGASYAIWEPVAEQLAQRGISVLVPDLLGFGRSRHIGTTFSLADHAVAVVRLVEASGATAPLVVGHSFGCAVAAELAQTRPERIAGLVLVSPPAFRDGEQARVRLGKRGWLARQVVRGTPAASLLCNAMCLTRGAAGRLMPRLAGNVPHAVARQLVEHTWPAYRGALGALLENNPVPVAIADPRRPTTVVLADADRDTPAEDVLDWPHGAVRVEVWSSDHLLPLRHADRLAELVASEVAGRVTHAAVSDGEPAERPEGDGRA